ncbi:MAG: FAD-dependent oxidoreductase [Proteiniphilum sp.]|uniref:FAD-dependent oxidoreductase n=1 Tax=Proteiniphilum sp. TaxID=1926877 RepID=UPI002B1F39AC|nr:FAD-dependent oxidoreductase [Proteiniphilum sp.]MEA5126733.1 FAD-dependent oxidoreductase [Proteiniphilum sp.]
MKQKILLIFGICTLFVSITLAQNNKMVLVEAESFVERGGWVLDQQFMDQMGSPFLMAHGMGKPVADASTPVSIPSRGTWYVYVHTWNWCAPWKTKEKPGRFQLSVNGTRLDNDLGLGDRWGWEYAGSIDIKGKMNTVALHDLTGFNGRCDAILFSKEKEVQISNEGDRMYQFRKKLTGIPDKPENGGTYDMVVVGAGTAGLGAAIKGAREGMKVALIHNRPVPGGNNSVEVQVVASGGLNLEPYPRLGDVIRDIKNVYRRPTHVDSIIAAEKNLTFFPNMHVFTLEKEGDKIKSVTAKHIETNKETIFHAPVFVDCTGDGNIGFLAGAEYRVGREMRGETRETLAPSRPDNIVLGTTLSWWSKNSGQPAAFPECEWAIQFNEESSEKVTRGSNWWETGFLYDQVNEGEYIRDYLFRAIYGNWAFLKNKSRDKGSYANLELETVFYVAGKRESRRLVGDVLLTQQDTEGGYIKYDDAFVTCTYNLDQHFPTPKNSFFFPGEEFISTMKHYFNDLGTPRRYLRDDQVIPPFRVPYRCLYSVNVDNLFMAGRNVSVSHIVLSASRVQETTGMMGELVGLAASLCKKYNCTPRDVYKNHLKELESKIK